MLTIFINSQAFCCDDDWNDTMILHLEAQSLDDAYRIADSLVDIGLDFVAVGIIGTFPPFHVPVNISIFYCTCFVGHTGTAFILQTR